MKKRIKRNKIDPNILIHLLTCSIITILVMTVVNYKDELDKTKDSLSDVKEDKEFNQRMLDIHIHQQIYVELQLSKVTHSPSTLKEYDFCRLGIGKYDRRLYNETDIQTYDRMCVPLLKKVK